MRTVSLSAAVLLLAAALAAPSGCGGGRDTTYVVVQGGIEIGSQAVRVLERDTEAVYEGTERRPFKVYDTTVERELRLSEDLAEFRGYISNRRVPGADYRTSLSRTGEEYSFLEDQLQTFKYSRFTTPDRLTAFEPDSACLMQALADKFNRAGVQQAVALVVVPSRGGVPRQLFVESEGDGALKVTSPGLPEVRMELDGSGKLSRARVEGIVIERGKAGSMRSKPFMPVAEARAVKEVRVRTPDRLTGGEDLELAGSLYVPAGKRPFRGVVLAGEFGPQDRTGGGFLAQVAERLVGEGFAVLTCDRRGVPESDGDYSVYTRETAVSDLNAQVDYMALRGDIDTDSICVVGYGEGGQLAAEVAASNPYVSSLVLMATPSVPLFPDLAAAGVVLAGEEGLQQPEVDAALQGIAYAAGLLSEVDGDTVELDGQELFLGWMRSEASGDPLAFMGELKIPVLVVQGGRDGLVPAGQAEEIVMAVQAGGTGTAELAYFEELGHTFGVVFPEGAVVPYREHPEVEAAVLDAVAAWLSAR